MDRDAEEQQVEEAQKLKQDGDQMLKAPKDLFCSACLCIFQMPVVLQCGHSFCRTCVQQTWAGKVSRKCPLCKQVINGGEPQVNFSLKSLSENYKEMHVEPRAARTDDSTQVFPHAARTPAVARCHTMTKQSSNQKEQRNKTDYRQKHANNMLITC